MIKNFSGPEDVIADESFQAWFFKQNEEAVSEWENWLELNPDRLPIVEQAIQLMSAIRIKEAGVPALRTEEAYANLQKRIDTDNKETPVVPLSRNKVKWWLSAAAAVLLIVGAISFWKFSPATSSINAQYGQVKSQQLPDGSLMMLNANSTAKLGTEWNEANDREVWLEGEAFFHVTKTPKKNRFIVHTNQLDVIVTGTQFNVWTRNNKTSVLLTEGSVTIRTADGKETKMLPGDFVEINNSNLEKKTVNEESVLAWKENKILFDNTCMTDVGRIINEHYGVKVTISDKSLNAVTISGMMENDNLDILLKSLEATNDFKITHKNNEIFISKP